MINLKEILKGHEGELFYSPIIGDCKLIAVTDYIHMKTNTHSDYCFDHFGIRERGGVCMLFPSRKDYESGIPTDAAWQLWNTKQNMDTDIIPEEHKEILVRDLLMQFDFEKVERYMQFVQWKWVTIGNNVPNIKHMIDLVTDLCNRITKYNMYVSSGGFTVSSHNVDGGSLRLSFNLTEYESSMDDILDK